MSKFKSYLVSYRMDGAQWNIEIPASSLEDAQRRLSQIHFGKVEGEVIATFRGGLGPFAMLAAAVRNLFPRASR